MDSSVTFLKLLKANDFDPLLRMIRKTIKHVETDKTIPKFHLGYMSMSFSKQNKTLREKVERILISIFYTKTSQEMKNIIQRKISSVAVLLLKY